MFQVSERNEFQVLVGLGTFKVGRASVPGGCILL